MTPTSTQPDSPVEVLRAAADRLDAVAAKATPGPWCGYIGHDQSHARVVAGPDDGTYLTGIAFDWPEEAVEDFDCLPRQEDIDWLNHMGPQVAPALSAWLRTEADDLREEQDSATEGCSECHGTAQVYDGDPLPFPCTDCTVTPYESGQHALTFARMVLGLPAVSDTTGEARRA